MAYEIISQNNTTTTLSDGTNTITVPARVTLATSTSYTISEVNNNTATLEGSDGSVIRDVPCVVVLAGEGGGGDQHNLGYYATQAALEEAHPTAEAGDWAIVGATDTVWLWDTDNEEWVDSDTKGQVTSVNNQTGAVTLTASDVGAATSAQGAKADTAVQPGDLATVATTGAYSDLTGTPTIPAAQVNSDWNASSGVAEILNKPTLGTMASESSSDYTKTSGLATVATTGSYSDLSNTPTIPVVGDGTITITQGGVTKGTFTTNQSGNTTIDVDAGGSSLPSQTGNAGKFLTTDGTDASWSNNVIVSSVSEGGISISSTNTDISVRRVTIGNGTAAAGRYGVAVGYNAQTGESGVAIGNTAKANGSCGFAAGEGATTTNYGIAIGCENKTTANYAIQIGGTYKTNSAANTFKVGNQNGNFEMMSADGTIPTDRLPNAINKYSTMPTAASTNVGWIVQYTGATDATYTHGYIYECKAQGTTPETYAWEAVEVQAGGGGGLPSQTGNAGKFLTTDGTDASWSDKPLVNTATGFNTIAVRSQSLGVGIQNAIAIGVFTNVRTQCVAIGYEAAATDGISAVAIGFRANCARFGVAIGPEAKTTQSSAIQLGAGTNSDANTFKVGNANGNFEIMSADGTIPTDRFATTPSADGTYVPTLTISSGTATRTWGDLLTALSTISGYDATKTQSLKNVQGVLTWVDD